jgi:hypothetical protein
MHQHAPFPLDPRDIFGQSFASGLVHTLGASPILAELGLDLGLRPPGPIDGVFGLANVSQVVTTSAAERAVMQVKICDTVLAPWALEPRPSTTKEAVCSLQSDRLLDLPALPHEPQPDLVTPRPHLQLERDIESLSVPPVPRPRPMVAQRAYSLKMTDIDVATVCGLFAIGRSTSTGPPSALFHSLNPLRMRNLLLILAEASSSVPVFHLSQ